MQAFMFRTNVKLIFLVRLIFSTAASCFVLCSLLTFGCGLLSAQAYVSVQANNLTHPDLAPNFLAGDTYQYVVSGPPNQPVYIVQNGSALTPVGQTDSNGTYIETGVEQAAWVGNYTRMVCRKCSSYSIFEFHREFCSCYSQ